MGELGGASADGTGALVGVCAHTQRRLLGGGDERLLPTLLCAARVGDCGLHGMWARVAAAAVCAAGVVGAFGAGGSRGFGVLFLLVDPLLPTLVVANAVFCSCCAMHVRVSVSCTVCGHAWLRRQLVRLV